MKNTVSLFDIHVHGVSDADTASGTVEAIMKIAGDQKSKGVDKLLLSIYPDTVRKMRRDMEAIRDAMARTIGEHYARIMGVHLEGPFLNPKTAGALKKESFLMPTPYNLRRLTDGYEDIIKLITIAPELTDARKIIGLCRDDGITVSMGHSDATYSEAEAGWKAGAAGITHLFNAMRPFHHREPGIAGFGLLNNDVYVEIIADGVHLDVQTLRLVFKSKPPDRIILISDAVKGQRAENGAVYLSGGALAGSGTTLKEEVGFLVKQGFDPNIVYRAASSNPSEYLNIS